MTTEPQLEIVGLADKILDSWAKTLRLALIVAVAGGVAWVLHLELDFGVVSIGHPQSIEQVQPTDKSQPHSD